MTQFEKLVGNNCGVAIAGIKTANLVCIKSSDYADVYGEIARLKEHLSGAGVVLHVLSDNGKRILLLVFRQKVMDERLAQKDVQKLLSKFGYPKTANSNELLAFLSTRFDDTCNFPHEIGVFLGYPLEDIVGFIACPHACKFSGLWKVYGDVDKATKLFDRYQKCQASINRRLAKGDDLKKIFAKTMTCKKITKQVA